MRIAITTSVLFVALYLSSSTTLAAPVDAPVIPSNVTIPIDRDALLSGLPSMPVVGNLFSPITDLLGSVGIDEPSHLTTLNPQQQDLLNKLTSAISNAAGSVEAQMPDLPTLPVPPIRRSELRTKWFGRSTSSDDQSTRDMWDNNSAEPNPEPSTIDDSRPSDAPSSVTPVDESGDSPPSDGVNAESMHNSEDAEKEDESRSQHGYWGQHGHIRSVPETAELFLPEPLPAALPVADPVDLPVDLPAGVPSDVPVPVPAGAPIQPSAAIPSDIPQPSSGTDAVKGLVSPLPVPTSV